TVSDEVVDALRGGQVKLANEQARYEIAFRQDLASLAELLRHGRKPDEAQTNEAQTDEAQTDEAQTDTSS
ncbi:MAG: hypothetical protein JJD93_19720, partial [Ilumatobacteraceae bacterium]|nr:hypothetical protein [Ilumatobacteraceae bacterium]